MLDFSAISFDLWAAFFLASTIMLAIPGPTVMLVVSYALARGRKTGFFTVPGVVLGDFFAMSVSLAGAGALLAASATAFTALKLAGAAYLIWLGIKLWRARAELAPVETNLPKGSGWRMFFNSFVVTALNPKGIVFFVAFVPQFIDVSQPVLPQFIVLEATFLALAALNVVIWALLAGALRSRFQRPQTMRAINRVGAGCMIGAGVWTATTR